MIAQNHTVSLQEGENLIAVEGIDQGGKAGLLADGVFDGTDIITDGSWRCSTTEEEGWNTIEFDGSAWTTATEYGRYGVAPWYKWASGMPTDTQAQWIWSADASGDNKVYFRKTITVRE